MASNYPHSFSPIQLGSIRIKNRLFSSGHMSMLHEGGGAAGGAGLIITEGASVHPRVASMHILAYSDGCNPGYTKVAKTLHPHVGVSV